MKIGTGLAAAMIACCGAAAQAQISSAQGFSLGSTPATLSAPEGAGMVSVDVSNMVHNNVQGSSWNRSLFLDVGEGLGVTGIAWDLTGTSIDPMLLSDVSIGIYNSQGNGIVLNPFESNTSGFETSTQSLMSLVALNHDFDIDDGELYIEFFLPSNPIAGPEASYGVGSMLTLEIAPIPAPGSLALGMGALALGARRRRS